MVELKLCERCHCPVDINRQHNTRVKYCKDCVLIMLIENKRVSYKKYAHKINDKIGLSATYSILCR